MGKIDFRDSAIFLRSKSMVNHVITKYKFDKFINPSQKTRNVQPKTINSNKEHQL